MYIICDPSHISGNRSLVQQVSQKALDMGFDGLMIETHRDPDNAWTDAAQQVTPDALKRILKELQVRESNPADMTRSTEMEYLRQLMDSADAEIIDLLARRMKLSERLGEVKKACNMTVYNPDRWREIVETRSEWAKKLNLPPDFILALYEKIHHESIRKQLEILDRKDKEVKE
jgi:chorismate mutase